MTTTSTRFVCVLLLAATAACARPRRTEVPGTSGLEAGLAEAERIASRGCYLCLREAAAVYASLLERSRSPVLIQRALENQLLIVLREVELQMPDSGARDEAEHLQTRLRTDYGTYFAVLQTLESPRGAGGALSRSEARERQLALMAKLESEARSSSMTACFFLALALQTLPPETVEARIRPVIDAHADDLSVKYQALTFGALFSAELARELIGMETGFGEVHLLLGQRAVMNGDLAAAHRDLRRAHELLPDSATITLTLANVTFSYARYADAHELFERVLENPAGGRARSPARLGLAKTLSHLRRHVEAIALLDDLLLNDARNDPGEKYYWRAWNHLQTGESERALDDAMSGLNAMRNGAIYRLAGIAAFNLNLAADSRRYFESALDMSRGDCDSQRYLGLLDAAEQRWPTAAARFSTAASCYTALISGLRRELAGHEEDITGLSNGLIAAKRAEIAEAEALRLESTGNAAVASRNAARAQ